MSTLRNGPMPNSPTLTEVLLDRYRQNDPAATERLFFRLRHALVEEASGHPYLAGLQRLHSAEDVVNELWTKVFESGAFSRFEDRGPGSVRAFLLRSLDCLMVDLHRRQSAAKRGAGQVRGAMEEACDDGPRARGPGPRTSAELSDWLDACERTLDGEPQSVWRARTVEGLAFEEIGDRHGKTAAAVRGVFHRALEKLHQAGLLER